MIQTAAKDQNMELKAGDLVKVPPSRYHRWKVAQGRITLIISPFCRVRVNWQGRLHNVPYRICDVKKI